MKKIIILALSLVLADKTFAQVNPVPLDTIQKAMINGQKSVTGMAQDILSNYLQVAAQNLTSNNSNLQLKLTYFALNGMDSVHKYNNDNFLRTKWQRNLEFVTAVGVDKNNKFNSAKGGFSYNFWNRRDAQSRYFTDTYLVPFNEEQGILNTALMQFRPQVEPNVKQSVVQVLQTLLMQHQSSNNLGQQLKAAIPGLFQEQASDATMAKYLEDQFNIEINQQTFSAEMNSRIDQFVRYETDEIITVPLNTYVHGLGKEPMNTSPFLPTALVTQIKTFIDQQVAANAILSTTFKAKTLIDLNNKVLANYQAMVSYIGRQPLLTFNYLYSYGKGTLLSTHEFGVTYLQGTGRFQTQKLGQIKASLTDTVTSDDPTGAQRNFKRNIVAFQAGYNQVLAVQKKVSVMEIYGALEQDWSTSGYISGNTTSKFYLDAYFRARLPTTPWIKFDLKFAPHGGNVFGFFDFTYNLDK